MTRLIAAAVFLPALFCSVSAFAITVTSEAKSGPESIAAAPDGGLILGSATSPKIFRAAKGETQAKVFIDASSTGATMFLGVLADGPSNTLWACQLQAVPGTNNRKSTLRSFDLTSGAPKVSWVFPGDNNTCNDIAIGPDKAAYASDTAGAKIYRIKEGASEGELVLENQRLLNGIDGLTFMGGVLYANNVASNQIYRIPMDATGKAGDPVQIWTDQPIKGPDGMRASADRLFIAENRNGRASMLTINGDIAHVTVVKDGLGQPTAIDVGGDMLWVGDRTADNATTITLPH
jgi:hypothetical protein